MSAPGRDGPGGDGGLTLRDGGPADAAPLAELAVRAIRGSGPSIYTPAQVDAWAGALGAVGAARIESAAGGPGAVVVAERRGVRAGFATLVIDGAAARTRVHTGTRAASDVGAELDMLFVDPLHAGNGVARRLVEAMEDRARERGCSSIRVDASLLARPVLVHLGYDVESVRLKRAGGRSFHNTWLVKALEHG